MARDVSDLTPIASRDELVAWIEAGEKAAGEFRVGTEHEKVPFRVKSKAPVPYAGPDGISALLEGLAGRTGWEPILDGDNLIGLANERSGGAISLEPGGQFELSGAPLDTAHETLAELERHLADLSTVAEPLGIGFLTLGLSPVWWREDTPRMPKQRYDIMTRYMPRVGTMGLDMMYRTCTAQVNLDFGSEADMVRKLRVSLALQPVVTALFSNSPYLNGRPSGFLSFRSEIWRHTDLDRTGMLPWAFEPGMGYERYVDWALDVPMYFVKRGGTYHDVAGFSFRDLMDGGLPRLPGERATISDWANHLGTLFPEVRLKRYLEMRGADMGPASHVAALSALWMGLLYDGTALDAAWDLVRHWTAEERQAMRDAVPRQALSTPVSGGSVGMVANQMLAMAREGLKARNRLDAEGRDESRHLDVLDEVLDSGLTAAERLLDEFGAEAGRVFDARSF